MIKQYEVTKQFTGGLLKGMVLTETTTVEFYVGFECKHPCGGSPYKVIAVSVK